MNDVKLLREAIGMMVEKIRSKKLKGDPVGVKFDMKKFQSLDDHVDMLNAYANKYLEKLGRGSSRAAYLYSSRFVLKIAINNKGIAQNLAEVEVSSNPSSKDIVAKVHKHDKEYKWLLSDLVRELKSPDEFTKLMGVDFEETMKQLKVALRQKKLPENASNVLKTIYNVAVENNLMFGDLEIYNHWGVTPDRRCVLLDYGFTHEVWDKHYNIDSYDDSAASDHPTLAPDNAISSLKFSDLAPKKTAITAGTQHKTAATKGAEDQEWLETVNGYKCYVYFEEGKWYWSTRREKNSNSRFVHGEASTFETAKAAAIANANKRAGAAA